MGRGLIIVFAQGFFYLSIMNLEYATVTTLVFATPIFLTALYLPFLGNKVGYGGGLPFNRFFRNSNNIRPGSDIFSIYALSWCCFWICFI